MSSVGAVPVARKLTVLDIIREKRQLRVRAEKQQIEKRFTVFYKFPSYICLEVSLWLKKVMLEIFEMQ